jgi:hypothetical protein
MVSKTEYLLEAEPSISRIAVFDAPFVSKKFIGIA